MLSWKTTLGRDGQVKSGCLIRGALKINFTCLCGPLMMALGAWPLALRHRPKRSDLTIQVLEKRRSRLSCSAFIDVGRRGVRSLINATICNHASTTASLPGKRLPSEVAAWVPLQARPLGVSRAARSGRRSMVAVVSEGGLELNLGSALALRAQGWAARRRLAGKATASTSTPPAVT